MRTIRRTLATLALGITLAGCATLRGSQLPVPELTPVPLVPLSQALTHYRGLTDAETRRAYRDEILESYLNAIESNYQAFTRDLQASDRGSGLGLDLLITGLTGATALAGASSVNDLATVTAIASGARSNIDKRLFFDRTLPAIVASMDADRAAIRAEIARKRRLPIQEYSLYEAIDDLNRLQHAGRLDRAVARMTRVAEADRTQQQARLNAIVGVCDEISPDADRLNQEFRLLVFGTDPATRPARLSSAADELGLQLAAGTAPTWGAIAAAFDLRFCDDNRKQTFIANLRTRLAREAGGGNGGN